MITGCRPGKHVKTVDIVSKLVVGWVVLKVLFGIQGVILSHPNAENYLERDVAIILKYFDKRGIKRDFEKTIEWIREDKKRDQKSP